MANNPTIGFLINPRILNVLIGAPSCVLLSKVFGRSVTGNAFESDADSMDSELNNLLFVVFINGVNCMESSKTISFTYFGQKISLNQEQTCDQDGQDLLRSQDLQRLCWSHSQEHILQNRGEIFYFSPK